MLEERVKILKHIHEQIDRNKSNLLSRYSKYYDLKNIFNINALELSNNYDNIIKYKTINDLDLNKKSILFYIPKDYYFVYNDKTEIDYIICLDGCIEIIYHDIPIIIDSFTKKMIKTNTLNCRSLENSHLLFIF